MTQTNGISVRMSGVTQRRQTAGYMPSPFGQSHALLYDDNWDKRFTWYDVPKMKRDPQIRMGLGILEAPMHGAKLVAKANTPQLQTFMQKTISRVWQRALRKIIKMNEFGHMAGEIEYSAERGKYRFHQLHAVAPIDAKPLRNMRSREIVGVRVTSIIDNAKGTTDLAMPNAFWCARDAEFGQPYGQSVLAGAREPWMEKAGRHGANDIRRLWFLKNAFHSGIIRYPIGTTMLPNGAVIDNQDLARQLLQNLETGGILVLPNTRTAADGTGDYEWYFEPAALNGTGLEHILEYPDRLDKAILTGMLIPPEVYEAGDKGSWSGRATTMQMFFSMCDQTITEILDTITRLILKPLAICNYGRRAEFEVSHESLAEQAAQEPETGEGGQAPKEAGAQPDPMADVVGAAKGQMPAKRMSVGAIIDDNPELYASIRAFSRGLWPTGGETRLSGWNPGDHPRGQPSNAGQFVERNGSDFVSSVMLADGREVKFVPHRNESDDEITIMVNAEKLEKEWSNDHFYLPRDGKGATEIGGRREEFERFLERSEPVQASRVHIHVGTGLVTFEDGRHRFAVLRALGASRVAVTVPKDEADEFRKRFDGDPARLSTDAKGHEHKPKGTPEGGQFTGKGGGETGEPPKEKPKKEKKEPKDDKAKFVGARVDGVIHAHAESVKYYIADAVGGIPEEETKDAGQKDKKPYDVKVLGKQGQPDHDVEVKSMTVGGKQVISVHEDALLRKVEHAKLTGNSFHTVVVDDREDYDGGSNKENYSGHRLYYRRGSGRYSLASMHPVKNEKELKKLIRMDDADLPVKARGELPPPPPVDKLKEAAAKASESRKVRDKARKEKNRELLREQARARAAKAKAEKE